MADARTTTLYVIAYDIESDKRRAKVHKTLSAYGQWTQFSLFECHLTEKEFLRLRRQLDHFLEDGKDSIRFYPLCQGCLARVETVGGERPAKPALYVI